MAFKSQIVYLRFDFGKIIHFNYTVVHIMKTLHHNRRIKSNNKNSIRVNLGMKHALKYIGSL